MSRLVTVVLILLFALPSLAQGPDRSAHRAEMKQKMEASEADVRALLDRQVEAWNKGDLEGYMAGYWNSDQLTFYSGGTITHGWQATLDRYKQRYQSAGHAMGKLDFSDLEVKPLGPQTAMARGQWHLVMPDKKELRGLFTVILRKFPEGWRIIHDHSSAE